MAIEVNISTVKQYNADVSEATSIAPGDRMEMLKVLYDNLASIKDIPQSLGNSKYLHLAKSLGYANYKLCTLTDLQRLKIFETLTYMQKEFFSKEGAAIAIFNTIGGKPVSVVFRSLYQKEFIDVSMYSCPYGIDLMKPTFSYGHTIFLTEGCYDADILRRIVPNVLACLTSNVTIKQSNILSTLTNRFIVAFDNDEAGKSGVEKVMQRLKNCRIDILPIFRGDKDIGDMGECAWRGDGEGFKERLSYYKEAIKSLV